LTKQLYIFSGLGADERAFQNLDFSGYAVTYIKWIQPQKSEPIENYAKRILDQIKTARPLLIGLSFGGLVAVEISKLIETEKTILISSMKTKSEIPFYYRLAGKFRIHKLLPTGLLKKSNFITNWFFGAQTRFDKQLLKQILMDTDSVFLTWAIDKIVSWKNIEKIQNLVHIHGERDRILPLKFINYDLSIEKGGHLMALNKSKELSGFLRQIIG